VLADCLQKGSRCSNSDFRVRGSALQSTLPHRVHTFLIEGLQCKRYLLIEGAPVFPFEMVNKRRELLPNELPSLSVCWEFVLDKLPELEEFPIRSDERR
jgi:hypothetical protein